MISSGAWAPKSSPSAGPAQVTAPVLVIAGEQDPGPLPAHADELAGIFPRGSSVVLPGAHYPWVTAPKTFADAVGRFLETPLPDSG